MQKERDRELELIERHELGATLLVQVREGAGAGAIAVETGKGERF